MHHHLSKRGYPWSSKVQTRSVLGLFLLASICFGISIGIGRLSGSDRVGKDLNEIKEMHGYIRPEKIFGHVHVAKTGGSTGKI